MSDATPSFAVIIPSFNTARTIASTVTLVHEQVAEHSRTSGCRGEIVIVDDCSTDETAGEAERALADRGAPGRVVRSSKRSGSNASRNAGVLASSGSVLVFIDGDDAPLPGWLDALLGAVTDDAVIAGGTYLVQHGRGVTSLVEPRDRSAFGFRYAVGGCLAVSRRLLVAVGGFDENITRGGSEVEFCIEAQLHHGATIVPVPAARVLHHVSSSVAGQARTHFAREQGHQYIERRLRRYRAEGRTLPGRSTSSSVVTQFSARRKAKAAGGWNLLAAEAGGRAAGRLVFGLMRKGPEPVRRGL